MVVPSQPSSEILRDFYGYSYDSILPSFVIVSTKFVLHRSTMKLLGMEGVTKEMNDAQYSPTPQEFGQAEDWLLKVTGIKAEPAVITPTTPPTAATVGTPGSFDEDVPYNLVTLQSLGALGNTDAWDAGEWVDLGDGTEAYWDGTEWQAGKAPASQNSPIDIVATGGGTSGITITVTGGPQVGAGTVTITGIAVDGTDIDDPAVVQLADGDTSAQIVSKLVTAIDGIQDAADTITVNATSSLLTVNLTNSGSTTGDFDSDPVVTIA